MSPIQSRDTLRVEGGYIHEFDIVLSVYLYNLSLHLVLSSRPGVSVLTSLSADESVIGILFLLERKCPKSKKKYFTPSARVQ